MTVSVVRGVGPALSGSLFSLSIEKNYLGEWLVWWAMMVPCVMAIVGAVMLPEKVWKREGEE